MVYILLQVKVWTWLAGEDAGYSVSESECNEELDKLKKEMVKAFDYAEGEQVVFSTFMNW